MSPTTTDQTADDKAAAAQAEKDRKAAEAAERKAKRERDAINKILSELPDEKRADVADDVTKEQARELVKAHKAEVRAAREKKAPMTLSQRRAILKLGEGPVVAKTDFNRLPLDYLVEVGLAKREDGEVGEGHSVKEPEEYFEGEGEDRVKKTRKVDVEKTRTVTRPQYSLTEKGEARVTEINPKWRTWKPDSASSSTPAPESTPEPVAVGDDAS